MKQEYGLGYRLPELPSPKEQGQEYRKMATVWAIQMDTPFLVKTSEGTTLGQPGDYLCEGPNKEMWVVKQATFEATYALVLHN